MLAAVQKRCLCSTLKKLYALVRLTKASLVAQTVKNPPAMRETWVWSLGWEDPLENGMATHSSILAWKIPQTVYSPWDRKESAQRATFTFNVDQEPRHLHICGHILKKRVNVSMQ